MKGLLAIFVATVILSGALYYNNYVKISNNGDASIACTMEAKVCPDGSYVGRSGPKCEFAPCKVATSTKDKIKGAGGIDGSVVLGPTCPVMRDPPEEMCADKPYQTNLELTNTDGSKVIKKFSSDINGMFKVSAPPGEYAIRKARSDSTFPSCGKSEIFLVEINKYTKVRVNCDTGIR